jgi:uncharacterized membrane protein
MPQNNKTNMTPEERELIRCWIENDKGSINPCSGFSSFD